MHTFGAIYPWPTQASSNPFSFLDKAGFSDANSTDFGQLDELGEPLTRAEAEGLGSKKNKKKNKKKKKKSSTSRGEPPSPPREEVGLLTDSSVPPTLSTIESSSSNLGIMDTTAPKYRSKAATGESHHSAVAFFGSPPTAASSLNGSTSDLEATYSKQKDDKNPIPSLGKEIKFGVSPSTVSVRLFECGAQNPVAHSYGLDTLTPQASPKIEGDAFFVPPPPVLHPILPVCDGLMDAPESRDVSVEPRYSMIHESLLLHLESQDTPAEESSSQEPQSTLISKCMKQPSCGRWKLVPCLLPYAESNDECSCGSDSCDSGSDSPREKMASLSLEKNISGASHSSSSLPVPCPTISKSCLNSCPSPVMRSSIISKNNSLCSMCDTSGCSSLSSSHARSERHVHFAEGSSLTSVRVFRAGAPTLQLSRKKKRTRAGKKHQPKLGSTPPSSSTTHDAETDSGSEEDEEDDEKVVVEQEDVGIRNRTSFLDVV